MQINENWALPLSPLEDIQLLNYCFNFKNQYRFLYFIMNCLFLCARLFSLQVCIFTTCKYLQSWQVEENNNNVSYMTIHTHNATIHICIPPYVHTFICGDVCTCFYICMHPSIGVENHAQFLCENSKYS